MAVKHTSWNFHFSTEIGIHFGNGIRDRHRTVDHRKILVGLLNTHQPAILTISKQLKRAGVPYKQLLHFYTAVIRPVLEHAVPAWHHLINRTQAQHLESDQNGLSIFNFTCRMSYPNVLFVAQNHWRLDVITDPLFKIFANQPPVFITSFHLPEIPPLPLG